MPHSFNRPPSLTVDEDHTRSDLTEVIKIFPDLPVATSWAQHSEYVKRRTLYLAQQDLFAYETILQTFPGFKPECRLLD